MNLANTTFTLPSVTSITSRSAKNPRMNDGIYSNIHIRRRVVPSTKQAAAKKQRTLVATHVERKDLLKIKHSSQCCIVDLTLIIVTVQLFAVSKRLSVLTGLRMKKKYASYGYSVDFIVQWR